MAQRNFTQFELRQVPLTGDYLVGYKSNATAEIKTSFQNIVDFIYNSNPTGSLGFSFVKQNSSNWQSNYSFTNLNSSNWQSTYSLFQINSSGWENTESIINTNSANWQNTYLTVLNNTDTIWNYQGTDLKQLSAGWQESSAFVNNNSSTIIDVNTIVNNTSDEWNSVYSSWNTNSALELESRTFVNNNSSNTIDVNTIVNNTSANWNSVYAYVNQASGAEEDQTETASFIQNNSANLLEVNSSVNTTSGNWNQSYNISTIYQNNSSKLINGSYEVELASTGQLNLPNSTSPNNNSRIQSQYNIDILAELELWTFNTNSTLTFPDSSIQKTAFSDKDKNVSTLVQQDSSLWYNASSAAVNSTVSYANNNFLPLTGGTISGFVRFNSDVTIFGNLTSTGTQTFANTIFSTTSSLSVIHTGSGDALFVGNNGAGHIASFYDIDQNIEMLHVGGINSEFPNVGIKVSAPNKTLTVNGEISSNDTIYDKNGNSLNWNSVYSSWNSNSSLDLNARTYLNSNSALDLAARTYVNSNSSNINNVSTKVNNTSGNWDSVYSSWNSNSALDLAARTYVNTNSANINNVNTKVNSTSANWDSVYSSWNSNSALDLDARTYVNTSSANITEAKTIVNTNSANWDSVYSSFNTASARTGDHIVQQIHLSFVGASTETTSNATTYADRASFVLDLGNTTKWTRRGYNGPEVSFYVIGRVSNVDTLGEFVLLRKDTSAQIENSYITTQSTATFQLLSSVLPLSSFPTTPTPVTLRTKKTGGTGTVNFTSATLELKWTAI